MKCCEPLQKILRNANVANRECCELLHKKVANRYKMSRFDWLKKERYFKCYVFIGLTMLRIVMRAVRTIRDSQEKGKLANRYAF